MKKNPKLARWYLKTPKTKSSRRTLPLTADVIDVLKAQRRRQLEDRMKAGKLWRDHGFIFADAIGEPWSQWVLYQDFQRILNAAGIVGRYSPKTGRHTVATLLLQARTNPKAVQERLGHSQITTTLTVYSHVLPGAQAEVGEARERLLKGKK